MIFHITAETDWAKALQNGTYEPPSLAGEGFIHLSTRDQTLATASRYYSEASGLVLLAVDETTVNGEVRWEAPPDPARAEERYPHLYGPLAIGDVSDARPFGRDELGEFVFPYEARL
jgi:uncharacterized protein (DUF952 family)